MQVEQIILFVAVAALALTLVVVLVAPRWRGPPPAGRDLAPGGLSAGPPPPGQPVIAQTGGETPWVKAAATPPPPPGAFMLCPTCRRQYAPGLRFCPYDARVLTLDMHAMAADSGISAVNPPANPGKICPSCSRRYDAVAMVCGRDGSALVSVN